jgi:hypothetical protein
MQMNSLTDAQYWLDRATKFTLLEFKIPETGEHLHEGIFLEKREQEDGSYKYILVNDFGNTISKKLVKKALKSKNIDSKYDIFVHSYSPSNRTKDHMKDTRFDTLQEAFETYKSIKDAYIDYMVNHRYAHAKQWGTVTAYE